MLLRDAQAVQCVSAGTTIEIDETPECQHRFPVDKIDMLAAGELQRIGEQRTKQLDGGFFRLLAALN